MSEYAKLKKCIVCEKEFLPAPFHAYRVSPKSSKLMCSYTCMINYERLKNNFTEDKYELSTEAETKERTAGMESKRACGKT